MRKPNFEKASLSFLVLCTSLFCSTSLLPSQTTALALLDGMKQIACVKEKIKVKKALPNYRGRSVATRKRKVGGGGLC